MLKKRKEIDNFLIAFNKFIWENKYIDDDIIQYAFVYTFKWNVKNMKNVTNWYKNIEFEFLDKHFNKWLSKTKPRTWVWLRKVAYWIEYKTVNDFSRDDVFWKVIFDYTKKYTPKEIITNHNKKIQTSFIIPEDWFHSDDIYIY